MRRPALSALLLILAACDPALEAHPEPGSRADSLIIHAFVGLDSAGGGKSLYSLVVTRCSTAAAHAPDTAWAIERAAGPGSRAREPRTVFRYGAVPGAEWSVRHIPVPLSPGCYDLDVEGSGIGGMTEFRIDSQGVVRWSRPASMVDTAH